MNPLALVGAGMSIYGALRAPKKKNLYKQAQQINSKFMGMNPGISLSPEDAAYVERTKSGLTRTASRSAEMGRQQSRRQISARGLSGASAAALVGANDETEALNRQQAADQAAGIEYGIGSSNRDWGRQKVMTAWGGELGAAREQAARDDAETAGMWNTITQAAPLIASSWSSAAGTLPAGAAGATPAAQPSAVNPGSVGGATYNPSLNPYRRSVQPSR